MTTELPASPDESIGKSSSPIREPNTTAAFYFWLKKGVKANPFDFVVVEQTDGSKTIGQIDEMFAYTDADSHLTNFIGDELGNPSAEPYVERVAAMVARTTVLANMRSDHLEELYMPVPSERKVSFANGEHIAKALGFDTALGTKIPAGIIKQSNGQRYPVYLDSDYIIGPEGAHANVTGISGLATKTSYSMFLLNSVYQKMNDVSMLLFNVKHSDLLHVAEPATDLADADRKMYEKLGLESKPFDASKVTYFLPRRAAGTPDSDDPPSNFKLYAYTLEDAHSDLDLLFAEVPDTSFTIDAFTSFVRNNWQGGGITFTGNRGPPISTTATTWQQLLNTQDNHIAMSVYNLPTHATPPRLKRELRRLTSHPMFVSARSAGEVCLGEEIKKNVKSGRISVVDIYRIPTVDRPFVIGEVMRQIEDLYREKPLAELPHLAIFIDELNTFAPATDPPNDVTRQIIEIASKGRGRRTALVGVQQFKSEVHRQVWGNCSLHVIGKVGSAELNTPPYRELTQQAKNTVTGLRQGEMLLSFKGWRGPIKIIFPRPPHRRPARI